MSACYIEIDRYCVEWLRNLVFCELIADGEVIDTSIEDIRPVDLRGFTQVHAFAGIGVWSHALRLAGWPDDRPVWTGSCPCQPFSSAGQGAGFGDERHLWPAWHHLIEQCRPAVVLGEQVASKAAGHWLDLVHTDMETLDYAFGAVPFPAAGVGAPHIRDRLYWVAHDNNARRQRGPHASRSVAEDTRQRGEGVRDVEPCCVDGRLADGGGARLEGRQRVPERADQRAAGPRCMACALADDDETGCSKQRSTELLDGERPTQRDDADGRRESGGGGVGDADGERQSEVGRILCGTRAEPAGRGPVRNFWSAADWIPCRDGKARPVEPGTFPLAHGVANRVGRLRAYGNAIVAPAAEAFIRSVMECMPTQGFRSCTRCPSPSACAAFYESKSLSPDCDTVIAQWRVAQRQAARADAGVDITSIEEAAALVLRHRALFGSRGLDAAVDVLERVYLKTIGDYR